MTSEKSEAELQKLLSLALDGWDIDGATYTELTAAHENVQAEIKRLVARVGELEAVLGRVVKKYDRDRLVNKYMDKEPDSSLSVLNVPLGAVRAAAQALANGEKA